MSAAVDGGPSGAGTSQAVGENGTDPSTMRQWWWVQQFSVAGAEGRGRPPQSYTLLSPLEFNVAVERALAALQGIWSRVTWKNRSYRFLNFQAFQMAQGKEIEDCGVEDVMAYMGMKAELKNSSKVEYLSTILDVGRHLKAKYMQDVQALLELRDAYRRASIHDVPHQARPISPSEVMQFWRSPAAGQYRVVVLLAWVLASRVDDIRRIEKDRVVFLGLKEWRRGPSSETAWSIMVDFSNELKSATQAPWALGSTALLLLPEDKRSLYEELQATWPREFDVTTDAVTRALKSVSESLSAHSLKRGAVEVLAQAAAEGTVDAAAIHVLAKHKGGETLSVPTSTTRYVSVTGRGEFPPSARSSVAHMVSREDSRVAAEIARAALYGSRMVKRAVREDVGDLPVHAKKVEPMNFDLLCRDAGDERLNFLRQRLYHPRVEPARRSFFAEIRPQDVEQLVAAGLIEAAPPGVCRWGVGVLGARAGKAPGAVYSVAQGS